MRALIALVVIGSGALAVADPHRIRLASIVPDGSGYARELHAMANDVESATDGRVTMKLYFGAVAGDELQMIDRLKRGQLDGIASAGMACEQLAPSLKVMRMPGIFETREEVLSVLSRLKPVFDHEFQEGGFRNLAETLIGPTILFTRTPARSLAEMRTLVWWVWDADKMMSRLFPVMGLKTRAAPIHEAAHDYEAGRVDGFTAPPSAALAFQWSSTAKYYMNVPLAYVSGCMVVSSRAFDGLDFNDQRTLLGAAAKAAVRIEDVSREMDRQLLAGLFKRQGLTEVPVSEHFWKEYREATRQARQELSRTEVPPALLDKVENLLVEIRGHHGR